MKKYTQSDFDRRKLMTREEAAMILEGSARLIDSVTMLEEGTMAASEACKMGAKAIRELDAKEKQNPFCEWISVKDRLPDDEQEVLVIAHGWDGRLVYVGSHKRVEPQKSWLTGITNKSSEWSLWGWSYLKEPMVTHWMPLPELPKEEHHAE